MGEIILIGIAIFVIICVTLAIFGGSGGGGLLPNGAIVIMLGLLAVLGKVCWFFSDFLINGLFNNLDIILKIPIQVFFTFIIGFVFLFFYELLKSLKSGSFKSFATHKFKIKSIFVITLLIVNFSIVWFGLNTLAVFIFNDFGIKIGLAFIAVLSIIASYYLTISTSKLKILGRE